MIISYGDTFAGAYPWRMYHVNGYLYFNYGGVGWSNTDVYRSPSSTITVGEWQHIALNFTYGTPSTMKMYRNGKLLAGTWSQGTGARAKYTGVSPRMSIGCQYSSSTVSAGSMGGIIDEVKIYDYLRTPAQIAWDYNQGKPVLEYKYDECSGATANNAALAGQEDGGNDGTITIGGSGTQDGLGTCTSSDTSEAWYNGVTGKLNSSINLDGTDDYISASDAIIVAETNLTYTGVSWGTWVYPNSAVTSKTLIDKNYDFRLTTDANGYPSCEIYSGSWQIAATYNTALPTSAWSHILCTYDGTNIKLYINGQLKATRAETDSITAQNDTLYIGRDTVGSNYFSGKIDDTRIYPYALTVEQIKTEFNQGAVHFGP